MTDIEIIKLIREYCELPLMGARMAMEIARDHANGDILVGAGYVHASGLAIYVKNDRHGWNLRKGQEYAESWRNDERFAPMIEALKAHESETGRSFP